MNRKIKKTLLFLGLLFVFLLKAGFVSALEVTYPTLQILNQTFHLGANPTFYEFVCYFMGLGEDLAIFIAVIMVAWGGILYMFGMSIGKIIDKKKGTRGPAEAKEVIKAGILGLLIVMCSYLIAYTINPNLNTCKLGILSIINLNSSNTPVTPPDVPIVNYQEIPMGILTEKLLSRTMDCYGFDQSGNPIDGDQTADDGTSATPTYLDHDRADCLLQLTNAAQNKGNVITTLSDAITQKMDTCNCATWGQCAPTCNPATGCQPASPTCPAVDANGNPDASQGSCVGDCIGNGCQNPYTNTANPALPPPTNCCPPDSGVKDPNNPTGPNLSVYNLDEHGPISLPIDVGASSGAAGSCETKPVNFLGLDEFRSNYANADGSPNYAKIKAYVEKTIQINGEDQTMIDTGSCTMCTNNCQTCDQSALSQSDYAKCQSTLAQCTSDYTTCQTNLDKCHAKSPWYKLPLIDQLAYLKGKTDEVTKTIQDDENVLDTARNTLSNCYLAVPYIDLLTTAETTNQAQKIVLTYPLSDPNTGNAVVDPVTNQPIDTSTYCSGFNYDNSSCLKQCDDASPDTSTQATTCYASCGICPPDTCQTCDINALSQSDYLTCTQTRTTCENALSVCKNAQEKCIENCYNSRPSLFGPNPTQTFGQDINTTTCDPHPICPGQCIKNTNGDYTCGGKIGTINDMATICWPDCPSGQTCDSGSNTCVTNNQGNISQNCMSSCQDNCATDCGKKYLPCSNEYSLCESQCNDNGQCALDNAGSCLFGAANFQNCANNITDPGNTNFCINNAYTCKNGSEEYAGYPDCAAAPSTTNCTNAEDQTSCEALSMCVWTGAQCLQNTSASFFDSNAGSQKCLDPFKPAPIGSPCYSSTKPDAPCIETCPETAKCPTASNCPDCSCDNIDQTMAFSIPNISSSENDGNEGYNTQSPHVSASQVVGPQCNTYSHNDDPLTFYCEDSWWADPNKDINPTPIGNERICPASGEVPVGQTVDNAESWANGVIASANKISQDTQAVIKEMVIIGQAINAPNNPDPGPVQNYCKCAAQFETSAPICKTGCTYSQTQVPNCVPCTCLNDPSIQDPSCGTDPEICTQDKGTCPDTGEPCPDGSNTSSCTNSCTCSDGVTPCPGGQFTQCPNTCTCSDGVTPCPGGDMGNCPTEDGCWCNDPYGDPYYIYPCDCSSDEGSAAYLNNIFKNPFKNVTVKATTNKPATATITTGLFINAISANPFILADASSCPPGSQPTGEMQWQCSCNFQPCQGKPCQQVTDYMSVLWNNYRQLKLDFVDFDTWMIAEPRSDILKQLTYSRQKTNSCSLINSAQGAVQRLFSCSRVEDELMPPINGGTLNLNGQTFPNYCYGTSAGDYSTPPLDLTDNWFCCQDSTQNPTPSKNPIYNIRNQNY